MRIRTWLAAAVLPTLVTTGLVFAQDQQATSFLTEARGVNWAGVEGGKRGKKRGPTKGVRASGKMQKKDHTGANQKARAAAGELKIIPPTHPNSKQKSDYDRLSNVIGTAFD